MYVKRIQVGNYRHLVDVDLGPFRAPSDISDLVVLAGPNGGGKTSILELISLALSNMWSLTYQLNRTASKSSFEVTIGLLPHEVALIQSARDRGEIQVEPEFMDFLSLHKSYCRSFGYKDGEYQKNPAQHNRIHDVVQKVLRGSYSRPLGFYLGADRSYRKKAFEREKIFSYTAWSTKQHAWSYAFQQASAQYEDMFDFLVTWRYHFARRLGSWILKERAGVLGTDEKTPPRDEYGDVLSKVFPGYQFIESTDDAPTDLFVRLPSGETISFSDLSSGEKEVFFTLCFFQRHDVEEAVLLIDEPELHLHPSLSRVLLRTMQALKPRNQIWLATQSPEIIDEAGRDRVFFVRRESGKGAEIFRATDEAEILACLRNFFGYSGYLGLARALVFTEGRNASSDRKLFSRLLPHGTREVKFIPANGCSEIERINQAVLAILESDFAWCKFFLIRDRDYLDDSELQKAGLAGKGRLFILQRHELENYLLIPDLIRTAMSDLYDKVMAPDEILASLSNCARRIAGNALRDMVAFRLNRRFRPEDFSVPPLLQGELLYDSNGWVPDSASKLHDILGLRATTVSTAVKGVLQQHSFEQLFDECSAAIDGALKSDGWITLLPGKEILGAFASEHGATATVLQNALIKELENHRDLIPNDLATVLATIDAATKDSSPR